MFAVLVAAHQTAVVAVNFTLWLVGRLASLARLVPPEAVSPAEVQRAVHTVTQVTVKELPGEPDPPRRYRDDETARRVRAMLDWSA